MEKNETFFSIFSSDFTDLSIKNFQNLEAFKIPIRNIKENFRLADILKAKYDEQIQEKNINF